MMASDAGSSTESGPNGEGTLDYILCEAPEPMLRARIAERSGAKRDPSEADSRVLEWQLGRMEVPSPDEGIDVLPVDTARSDALDRTLRDIGSVPPLTADQSA